MLRTYIYVLGRSVNTLRTYIYVLGRQGVKRKGSGKCAFLSTRLFVLFPLIFRFSVACFLTLSNPLRQIYTRYSLFRNQLLLNLLNEREIPV